MNFSKLFNLFFLFLFFSCKPSIQKYHLKEIPDDASCFSYQIVDDQDEPIELPKHIMEALICSSNIDMTDNVLTYLDGLTIKLFQINKGMDTELFSMHEGMDGISNPVWSEDRKRIMFVVINQNQTHGYTESARIISLDLDDNMQLKAKQKFDRPVNFICGSSCSSLVYQDFKYVKEGIMFRRNINIEKNPGEYELIVIE